MEGVGKTVLKVLVWVTVFMVGNAQGRVVGTNGLLFRHVKLKVSLENLGEVVK